MLSLIKEVKFFKESNITEEEHGYIIRKLKSRYVQKGTNVITYGEFGKEFFILLRGTVEILLPKLIHDQDLIEESENEGKIVY